MTRMIAVTSITRSRGLPGVFRPLAVVLLLALCGVARAHIDPDDPDHSPQEFFSRPSPPPPARDPDIYGGLYDGIVTWKNDSNPITVMCTVVIKEQLYVEPGAVIRVRPNCSDVDARRWGMSNPGGVGALPSIIILPGASIHAVGTPELPIVFMKDGSHSSDAEPNSRGDWGGILLLGSARVSQVDTPGNLTETMPTDIFPPCHDMPDDPSEPPHLPRCEKVTGASGASLEYGGDDDEGSCGRMEHVIVLNAGGSDNATDASAVGVFACGHRTRLSRVEVAHSAGNGVTFRGGTAFASDLAVWNAAKDGVRASNGYRGLMKRVFVNTPTNGRSSLRAEGTWGGSGNDTTTYRTHPVVYGATLVADAAPTGPDGNLGIVDVALGSGITLANSIVFSTSNRTFGVRVSRCSSKMIVGHADAIGAPDAGPEISTSNDRVFFSDNNIVFGIGSDPSPGGVSAYPRAVDDIINADGAYRFYGERDSKWKPFHLESGCEGKLGNADGAPPQLRKTWFPGSYDAPLRRFDPRPTVAMRATAKVDPIPKNLSRFVAVAKTPTAAKAFEFLRGEQSMECFDNATCRFPYSEDDPKFPGAFTDDPESLWYLERDLSHLSHEARGATLQGHSPERSDLYDLAYARVQFFDDVNCTKPKVNVVARQNRCHDIPDWFLSSRNPVMMTSSSFERQVVNGTDATLSPVSSNSTNETNATLSPVSSNSTNETNATPSPVSSNSTNETNATLSPVSSNSTNETNATDYHEPIDYDYDYVPPIDYDYDYARRLLSAPSSPTAFIINVTGDPANRASELVFFDSMAECVGKLNGDVNYASAGQKVYPVTDGGSQCDVHATHMVKVMNVDLPPGAIPSEDRVIKAEWANSTDLTCEATRDGSEPIWSYYDAPAIEPSPEEEFQREIGMSPPHIPSEFVVDDDDTCYSVHDASGSLLYSTLLSCSADGTLTQRRWWGTHDCSPRNDSNWTSVGVTRINTNTSRADCTVTSGEPVSFEASCGGLDHAFFFAAFEGTGPFATRRRYRELEEQRNTTFPWGCHVREQCDANKLTELRGYGYRM